MKQFSQVYSVIILISAGTFILLVIPRHMICALIEWFYVKFGRNNEARDSILSFFKKTSFTMIINNASYDISCNSILCGDNHNAHLRSRFCAEKGVLLVSAKGGSMIYVVVEELIPEMSEGEHSNIGVIMFSVGFTLMMILDVALS